MSGDLDLAHLRDLVEGAAPNPWEGSFEAAMRNAVPVLLDRVEAQAKQLDEVRALVDDNEQAYTRRQAAWSREKVRADNAEAAAARVEGVLRLLEPDDITPAGAHKIRQALTGGSAP